MKLPAYGKELLAARTGGARPAQPVVVTDSWAVAAMYRAADLFALVCAPPSEPFDFGLLYGLDVMLMFAGDDVLGVCERVAQAQPERMSVLTRSELMPVIISLRARLTERGDPNAANAQRALRELAALELA